MKNSRNLEFLYEIGCLRFINRAWKQFLGPNFANLADHHLRVIWTSLILAKMEGQGDPYKIMKMALVHDIGESRAGDVHYISRQYTKRDEEKAVKDILFNTNLGGEFLAAWEEYEERKTIEAKIVKDADWLDVDLEIQEQKAMGRTHMKSWDENRKIMSQIFHTKSAKKLWKEIKLSDPTKWYKEARNRFMEGDIKKIIDQRKRKKQ